MSLLFKHFWLTPLSQGEADAPEKKFFSSEDNPSFDTRDQGDDISRRRLFNNLNKEDVAYPRTGVCVARPLPVVVITPPLLQLLTTPSKILIIGLLTPSRYGLGSDVHFDKSGQTGKAFTHGLVSKILLPFTSTDLSK